MDSDCGPAILTRRPGRLSCLCSPGRAGPGQALATLRLLRLAAPGPAADSELSSEVTWPGTEPEAKVRPLATQWRQPAASGQQGPRTQPETRHKPGCRTRRTRTLRLAQHRRLGCLGRPGVQDSDDVFTPSQARHSGWPQVTVIG